MKKEAYSKTAQKRILAEAKRHKRKGVVVCLDFKTGRMGYQGRVYKFPGEWGERNSQRGKFGKTKFFALSSFGTWKSAAEAAYRWTLENQPSNGAE